jgi:arylsulfatase A-like enzyme
MNRREFIEIGATAFASVSMAPSGLFAAGGDSASPNLLIIHTDEHNFRTLGCYRDTLDAKQAAMWGEGNVVETPHIDAIARNGALCTNYYATSPVCTPSRAALVSGQYPQETNAYQNNRPLNDSVVTFASLLKQNGYVTGYAGKWHLDGDGKPQWDPERDFGFSDNRHMFNRGHWKTFEDTPGGPRVAARKGNKPSYDVAGADSKSFATDWLADKAVEFIKANTRSAGSGQGSQPFCYMVSLPDPHGPDSVRAPYNTMYADMKFKKPHTAGKSREDVPSWASPKGGGGNDAAYFGMVKCIDDNVGKIMKVLEQEGLTQNTIVVFTADHGDLRGEHGRQNKGVPLEGSAKIPFVIQWPGRINPGTRIAEAMGCVDFLPTILSMMNCKTAGKESGRDASGFFVGSKPANWEDVAILRKGSALGWVCAVSKRYKLVLSPQDPPWLIDKQEDPDELINFAHKQECRDSVRKLAKAMAGYHRQHHDPSLEHEKMQRDLAWAVGEVLEYETSNDGL